MYYYCGKNYSSKITAAKSSSAENLNDGGGRGWARVDLPLYLFLNVTLSCLRGWSHEDDKSLRIYAQMYNSIFEFIDVSGRWSFFFGASYRHRIYLYCVKKSKILLKKFQPSPSDVTGRVTCHSMPTDSWGATCTNGLKLFC